MDYVFSQQSLLSRKGFALSKTYGKSMRPLIWGGCHCVAVVPLTGEPAIGDLLMFNRPSGGKDRNIVHRLVEIRQEEGERIYLTRGDNCISCEHVRRDEIIGRIAEVHRISAFRPWHIIPKKRFSVTDRSYIIYSRIWSAIWPARRICYILRAHANGLIARVLKLFKG